MPGIFFEPINRKQFLSTAMGTVGAMVLSQSAVAESEGPKSFRMAILSDTHTPADRANVGSNGFLPYENLEKIVPQVMASNSECAIINGDAARLTGEVADYESLKGLLKPLAEKFPIYIGLGNHDHREHFYRVIGKTPSVEQDVKGKHTLVVENEVVRIVVLDSLLYVNRVAGLVGKAQREWLAKFLEASDDRPTVLFVHHTLDDNDGALLDVDRLFAIIKPYRQVKAIFYGHSHRYHIDRHEGVQLVNLPAVGYNFADSEPVGWIEAEFTREGVSLKLNAIGGNLAGDGKTTQVRWA